MTISKLTVYDINKHSTIEQILELIKKQNEVIELVNWFDKNQVVSDFDFVTGNLQILPRFLLNEKNSSEDDNLWKEKF